MANGTHILTGLSAYLDLDKYRYAFFVFFLALYALILCTNGTIIHIIWIHRNLHEPMYIFIAALSLNSLFFSTAIYPKLFVDVLSQGKSGSHTACLLQLFCFYTFGASDFFLLLAMAIDRFVSICKPLQYATTMRTSDVTIFLALAWLLPACQIGTGTLMIVKQKMCTFISVGIFCNNSANKLLCVRSQMFVAYGVFIFLSILVLPVLSILLMYIRIFIVVHRHCDGAWQKATDTCLPHLIVLICFSFLAVFDVIMNRMESKIPKTVRLIMMLQIVEYNPLLNPIIYGVKMKKIRKQIKSIKWF
ncbi:olfactory receptor 1500-like [Vanacampus margaritifer]